MKMWAIPVCWQLAGIAMIPGDTLEEAIQKAQHDDSVELPYGEYIDGSFEVSVDDEDCIRQFYNKGQADDDGGRNEGEVNP